MASIPSEFEGTNAIADDTSKSGDEGEAETGPESETLGSVSGDGAASNNGDGFEPVDDSSTMEQNEESTEGGDDEDEEGPEDEGSLGDGLESGGDDDEDDVEDEDLVGDEDAVEDVDGVENEIEEEEEAPLALNHNFINQANGGAIDGVIEALQGDDEDVDVPDGGGDENGQDEDDNDADPNALVLLPPGQLSLLGITQAEYEAFPKTGSIGLEVGVVIAASLLSQVSASANFNITTYPLMQRALDEDHVTWYGYVCGEVARAHAASGLRLDSFMWELCSQCVVGLIRKFAEGDPQCINLRAALQRNGELVVPFVPRIRALTLGRGESADGAGGVNGG